MVRFLTEILDDFRRFVDEIWRFETEFWAGLLRFEPPKPGAAAGVCGPPALAAGPRAAGGRSE